MVALWQFLAATLVSYLGLPLGFCLGFLTKEEMPTARKYFPVLERIVILAIAAITLDSLGVALAARAAVYALFLLLSLFAIPLPIIYCLVGITLAVSRNDRVLLISSLVFIFGLLSGSDYFAVAVRKKFGVVAKARSLVLKNAVYVAIAILAFQYLKF